MMGFTPENCSHGYGPAKYSNVSRTRQHVQTVHASWWSLFAHLHERLSQKQTMTRLHHNDSVTVCPFLSISSLPLPSPPQVYLHRPTPSPLLRLSCLQRLLLPSTLPWVRCCWPHARCHQDMPTTPLQLSCTWTTQPTTPGKQWCWQMNTQGH